MSESLQNRAKTALERYFRKRSLTRFTLSFLVTLTGLFGFLLSIVLLHLGVSRMGIRYPVAVIGAYGFFLAVIRVWVEVENSTFDPHAVEIQEAIREINSPEETRISYLRKVGSWSKWLSPLDLADASLFDGEGCLLLLAACIVIGLAVTLMLYLANIPTLLADGFLDAFLVVGLYRRLRIAAKEHWLETTIRKTWTTVMIIAAILAFSGWCLQNQAPGCHSIGPAIQHLFQSEE